MYLSLPTADGRYVPPTIHLWGLLIQDIREYGILLFKFFVSHTENDPALLFLRENFLNLLATIRQRRASWTRGVLGLFVLAWLNLAFQSCAMAAAIGDLNDDACLACPPTHSDQVSSQNMHEGDHRCPDASHCMTNAIQCTSVDEMNGGRVARVKVKDAPSDVPLVNSPLNAADSLETSQSVAPAASVDSMLPGALLPLNVLHCVYLI